MISDALDERDDSLRTKLRYWRSVLGDLEMHRESGHVLIEGETDKENEEDEKTTNLIHHNINKRLEKLADDIQNHLKI